MTYDYVIVGGGSGGATLAGRLSEDPSVTVCLLEAGGEGKDLLIRAPAGVVAMLPGRPKINNWCFETVPQPGHQWPARLPATRQGARRIKLHQCNALYPGARIRL